MANLTLCSGIIATTPYYIVSLGVNIYSIEELCYSLYTNAFVLDSDLMDDKLCDYLEKQLNMEDLAERLRLIISAKKSLSDFVAVILNEIAYCDEEEVRKIKQILLDNAGLGYARKRKARGDNMLNSQKYTLAIDEYLYVLHNVDKKEEPDLYSAILHNIGTAYARLFLFEKAASYYKQAYEIGHERESRIQYLMALRLTMRREQYERLLLRFGYEEDIVEEAEDRMNKAQAKASNTPYIERYEEIKELKQKGKISGYYKLVDTTLNEWKQEYRKNMIARGTKQS